MNYKFLIVFLSVLVTGSIVSGQNTPDLSQTQPAGSVTGAITLPPSLNYVLTNPSWMRTYVPVTAITDPDLLSDATSPEAARVSTLYKDGFNRTLQIVSHYNVSGASPHLVQAFDTRFQKEGASFLPYPAGSAAYNINMFSQQQAYYNTLYPNEGYTPYGIGKSISDANSRAAKSLIPGKSQVGQGRGTTVKQTTNAAGEVKIWEVDGSGAPVSPGTYPAGMLFGKQAYDGLGANTITYTDRDGHVVYQKSVQKSVVSGQSVVDVFGITQYIYDAMGRLAFILPPNASDAISGSTVSATILDNLCFQYRYDSKGRQSAQRKPGEAGFTEVVYDNKQRPVMRRSPNEASVSYWEVTFLDAQGRIKATSLLASSATQTYWQGQLDGTGSSSPADLTYYLLTAAGQAAYPAENAISGNTMMSYSYYDNYALSDPDNSFYNSCVNTLVFIQQSTTANAEVPVRSNRTYGMLTGGRTRIMPSPTADPAKTGQWRKSAVWYDDKGRVINTASQDLYQGSPIHASYGASQYDFSGKVLVSKQATYNANSTDATQTRMELYRNDYEAATGRLLKVSHRVDNNPWQILAMYQYDELGRAKRNILGNYGEVQDMAYNIRGQLTGINATYAETGNRQGESRSFGESLKYDFGFSTNRYDGKIAGMIWRGANTANGYAYGYQYDKAGRLTQADFRRKFNALAWENQNLDYSVSNLGYDLNGNIQSMKQRGMGIVNGNTIPVTMDDMTYSYTSQSNQLLKVTDPQPNYNLGDFVNTNGSSNDYAYDANGNLTLDNNKGITSVTYTHFDKPQVVHIGADKRIEYSYDAAGNKVQELVIDPSTTTKRTDYIGNNTFEGDKVQYLLTGNGRTTFSTTGVPNEEFFVKDHLGNVRSMVDVYSYATIDYVATYEVASANLENMFFENIDEVRDDRPGATWNGDLKSARLNGAEQDHRTGTSALLKVMAGDKVEMNVNNFYEDYDPLDDEPIAPEEMMQNVIATLSGGEGGLIGEAHDSKLITDAFSEGNINIFNDIVQGISDSTRPQAFLNYVLFDETMHIVNSMTGAFQANGNGTWTQIGTTAPMEIPENGYLAVYLTNRSQLMTCAACANVFFDQLVIRFTRGGLKEETHYYPHGLPMAGMGSTAVGFKENKRKYQGNEYNKDFGLNWMDFQARQYDPQLGRFLGVDPLADAGGQQVWSPYAAMGNAPESMVDPNGTIFQVTAKDPALRKQYLDAWFGSNNYSIDGDGWVTITSDQKASAISTYMEYLMSGAKFGSGGGVGSTQAEMNRYAISMVEEIMDPNVKNCNKS